MDNNRMLFSDPKSSEAVTPR